MKAVVAIGLVSMLSFCDVHRFIYVSNGMNRALTVQFVMKECSSEQFSPEALANRLNSIRLGPIGTNSTYQVVYGFGAWREEDVQAFRKCVDTVYLTDQADGTQTVLTGESLKDILPTRRKGLGYALKIKIEE